MLKFRKPLPWAAVALLASPFFAAAPALRSQISPVDLPNVPGLLLETRPAPTSASGPAHNLPPPQRTPSDPPLQTARILGIMPNFRSVTADQKLPPQTVQDKFLIAGSDSFDYSSFLIAGIQAGFSMSSKSYPKFHQGAVGYRYYWHTLAHTGDENFLVGGALPALLHQDSRFYTLGHGSFDDGSQTFNTSEIVGAGAAAGISSTYSRRLPRLDQGPPEMPYWRHHR